MFQPGSSGIPSMSYFSKSSSVAAGANAFVLSSHETVMGTQAEHSPNLAKILDDLSESHHAQTEARMLLFIS
jgi:hypothetical protein